MRPRSGLKALPVIVEGRGMVMALVRGDHRLNEIKLRNALGADSARRRRTRSRPSSARRGSSARSAHRFR